MDKGWVTLATAKLGPESTINLIMIPATLRRRGNTFSVRVDWISFPELYPLRVDPVGDMTFGHGEDLQVIISTVTGPSCINGHARVEAYEVYPDIWKSNAFRRAG